MQIIGIIASREEKNEIINIINYISVGQRAKYLGQLGKLRQEEEKNLDKLIEEVKNE